MTSTTEPSTPLIDSVLLPSDFSAGSEVAFHHALKAALVARAKLTILHVSRDAQSEWTDFPGVRETLERWGLLPAGSHKADVPRLGVDIRKVVARHDDPVKSVLHYLEEHPADLIVLASHHHEGRASWLKRSVSEPVARKSGQMTLLLPDGVPGFVAARDGAVLLSRILIPIAATPRPQPALLAAQRLVTQLNCPEGTFTLLHVGDAGSMPAVRCPEVPGWRWDKLTVPGDVIDGIVKTADDMSADLVVMSTDGRNGFLDALRGSHSERVLRRGVCPLLAVPEGSLAAGSLEA